MATQAQLDAQAQIAEDLAALYPNLSDEKIDRLASAIERAASYPIFGDGMSRPVAISNITWYTASNGQERVVLNLAAKTLKCYGQARMNDRNVPMPNANISQPADWNLKFQKGDYVSMWIQDGEVKKLYPANTMQAQQISVNSSAVARTEQAMHGGEAMNVDPETGEATPAAQAPAPAAPARRTRAAAPAPKAAAIEADPDDLPF